ncbi:MAG: SAM-dependent chlorinase/fluorinase [Verrucomicrobiota bacterium]
MSFGPVITLLTDFGEQDGYVAAMKGVILKYAPDATVVDASHDVPPQDIPFGAWTLNQYAMWYPENSVHVGVVDPGVGTERDILLARAGGQWFLVPDNGLLAWALSETEPEELRALTPAFTASCAPSSTFHGRDIFARVAAGLVAGELNPLEIAHPVSETVRNIPTRPRTEARRLVGEVVHIDRFGNLISNIRKKDVEKAGATSYRVHVARTTFDRLSKTYGEAAPGTWMALWNSCDHLEVAVVNGSAAGALKLQREERVVLEWT